MKVTIVGAGIVGSAVAYELASRGAQVSLIDERGEQYQVVMTALDAETAEITIANRTYTVTLEEL